MDVNNNQTVNPTEINIQPIPDPINNQRGNFSIILGVLVLVLVLVSGAYFLGIQNNKTVTQNETTNTQPTTIFQNNTLINPTDTQVTEENPQNDRTSAWETYTNTQYGYTFKYPNNLFERNGAVYTKLPGPDLRPDTNMLFNTYVYRKSDYQGPSINEPVGTKKEVADKTFGTITQKLTLNNHAAIKMREDVLPGSQTERVPGTVVLVDLGESFLSIWISQTSEVELAKYQTTFDQVISTFKFTN